MHRTLLSISLAAGLLGLPDESAARAVRPASFEWMRPIAGDVQAGQIFRIEVPPEVLSHCDNFPHDIRIFDDQGVQWPFFFDPRPAPASHRNVPAELINEAWVEGDEPYLRVDLVVERDADGSRPRHQRILLNSSGQDFVRRVEIYGSEQQTDWALLGKGYLVHVREPRRIEENAIDYPTSDYPHLQIRVYPNTRDAREIFELVRASLQSGRSHPAPPIRLDVEQIPTPASELRDDAQVILLDLGYEKHPMESVRLLAQGRDYVRQVVVYTRDHAKQPWRFGGAGDIHRIGHSVKDLIPVRREGRYIKCEVYHYDDAPLQLSEIDVFGFRDQLVIEAQSGSDPIMYYGGAHHVPASQYDLRVRTTDVPLETWELRTLGNPMRNPDYRVTGYGKWGPILAAIAVGITSIGVLIVIVMMFRHAAISPPE